MNLMLLLPVLGPMLCGAYLLFVGFSSRTARNRFSAAVVVLTSCAALIVLFTSQEQPLLLLRLNEQLNFSLKVDGLSKVFGSIVSILWVPTTFYAFEYMKHEGKENRFFGFFLISLGVTLGISLSANPLTLYFFYECLTLATLPLVMHAMDFKARAAGRRYLLYSMTGSALFFACFVVLCAASGPMEYTLGGFINASKALSLSNVLPVAFLVGFIGCSVKAALFPLHGWLLSASVAPTPVTALLHAVAVVKAGVFAVIRLIYYSFGTDLLYGTTAQTIVLGLCALTIVFGSAGALRTAHFKRRLAYSTISNLSYLLFGAALMTSAGLVAALVHMTFHAILKITLFFCAGAVFHQTGNEYVYDLTGYGRAMPITMACFTVTAFGLMGVPPLGGFTGKWLLGCAAVGNGLPMGYVGLFALIVSAILTWLYLVPILITAYFPPKDAVLTQRCEAGSLMTVPLIALATASIVLALGSSWLISTITAALYSV